MTLTCPICTKLLQDDLVCSGCRREFQLVEKLSNKEMENRLNEFAKDISQTVAEAFLSSLEKAIIDGGGGDQKDTT